MKICPYCGQRNYDYTDKCEYCGEQFYITVDHNQDKKKEKPKKRRSRYRDNNILKELLTPEEKKKEDINELDAFINEITASDNSSDDIYPDEEYIGDIYPDTEYNDDTYSNKTKNTYNNPNNTTPTNKIYSNKKESKRTKKPSNNNERMKTPINISDNIMRNNSSNMEDKLKRRIRRNKQLEQDLGLIIKNIEVISNGNSIDVVGEVMTNTILRNKQVTLSIICYNESKEETARATTEVKLNHSDIFKDFKISFNFAVYENSMLILLPEIKDIKRESRIFDKPVEQEKRIPENRIYIERLNKIEDKIGMNIDNTSVIIKSNNSLEVVGEIYIDKPEKYESISIVATCYSKNNEIIATETKNINTQLFLGFDTLNLKIDNVNVSKIERIKLYPTLQ